MEKRLKEYIKYMETIARENSSGLSSDKKDEAIRDLLIQIGFFQHERFVHLIVTVVFAILTMITLSERDARLLEEYIEKYRKEKEAGKK